MFDHKISGLFFYLFLIGEHPIDWEHGFWGLHHDPVYSVDRGAEPVISYLTDMKKPVSKSIPRLDNCQPDDIYRLSGTGNASGGAPSANLFSCLSTPQETTRPRTPSPYLTSSFHALFQDAGGDLREFCLATALDWVVRQLRGKIPSERWATFIHIGA